MSLHRFFSDTPLDGDAALIEGAQARQIARVLRLRAGDRVVLVHEGQEAVVRLLSVSASRVETAVEERRASAGEPRARLTLALPILRGERSEEVVEAVTQLGVARIVPFVSERSVVRKVSGTKRARWERIARESAETARRGRVPRIDAPLEWSPLLDVLDPPLIVCWEEERSRGLREALPRDAAAVSMVVGPEGGFAASEVELARSRGAVTASLGPRNLRSETAAIAAVALALEALG